MTLRHILPPNLFETIDKAGICLIKEILTLSVLDIKKYTHLNVDEILLVKNIVSDKVCPIIRTCDVLKKQNKDIDTRISTGCKGIDTMLKGGLRRGTLTELFGESGSGKTQLSLQIALSNWCDGSVFICTEDLFPSKRFEELKRSQPLFDCTIDYGKFIFVEHVTERTDLLSCISVRLPKLLTQYKLSVLIVDSIAAPYRCESTNYIKRAEELREIAILLTSIAQKYNLAVLCINQVTASFDDSNNLLPSLGLVWSNIITNRLKIVKTSRTVDSTLQNSSTHNYVRELSVMFSSDLPNSKVEFIITTSGIQTRNTQ